MAKRRSHIDLIGMTAAELELLAESFGQPKFRGRQISAWIYKHNVIEINEMTNLPMDFISQLKRDTLLYRSKVKASKAARDGTNKFLLELEDGETIEAVLLPYEERVSVCISSQVGCAAGCTFCATAMGGLKRNLTSGEIVDEVLTLQKASPRRISHVVYMGMGEPLLNYEHVLKSIRILNSEVGVAMRHITISTVGITPRIERLAKEKLQLTLAVSLHAPNDSLRCKIIPVAEKYPLKGLLSACKHYEESTKRRITFEYLLMQGVNDTLPLAHELADITKGIHCNVNLIPYNAVEGLPLSRPSQARVRAFRSVLEKAGVTVTQRVERGHAVSAACGQLRRRG